MVSLPQCSSFVLVWGVLHRAYCYDHWITHDKGGTWSRAAACRTTHKPLRVREHQEHVMKIATIDEAQTQLPALMAAIAVTGEPVLIYH